MLKGFRTPSAISTLVGVAVVYFAAAKLGLSLALLARQVSVVWPASGVALAAVVVLGYRVWPAVTVGAFLANLTTGAGVAVSGGIAVGNTLEALSGAWLLSRIGFRPSLGRLRDALGLVVPAALASTAVSATIGVTSLCLGELYEWRYYRYLWQFWWLGDAVGNLVVAPVLLIAVARPRLLWPRWRIIEAGGLAMLLVGVCLVVFLPQYRLITDYPFVYGAIPLVMWAALRFGPPGSVSATLLLAAIALAGTLASRGPFRLAPLHDSLVLLQSFVGTVAATGLLIAGATAERQDALGTLQSLNENLERRVADRSAELGRRAAQLRGLALQLIQVEQRERRRLAGLLHDQLQQTLVAAQLHLDQVDRRPGDPGAHVKLKAAVGLLQEAIAASRSLAIELSPPVLHDAGLIPALRWLGRQMQADHGLAVDVEAPSHLERLDEDVGAFVFMAVRELLSNVARHSGTKQARVAVTAISPQRLRICVDDRGAGFDPAVINGQSLDRFGLLSIQERVEQLGGEFRLEAAPEQGVQVTLTVPLPATS
jgi:signal transduction histidine kinase